MIRAFVRFFLRALYHPLAGIYDPVSWVVSAGQWRQWQVAALPYVRGPRVLEIAHGTGHMLQALRAAGLAPVGVDESPAMGALAQRLNPEISLTRARVQALPFPSAHFDTLLSTFPTEFIVDPRAIAEFGRVLKPGGALVCVPSAQLIGPGVLDSFARWLFRVTGQAAPEAIQAEVWAQWVERYAAQGFAARVEQVALPRSVVTVLIATRPER